MKRTLQLLMLGVALLIPSTGSADDRWRDRDRDDRWERRYRDDSYYRHDNRAWNDRRSYRGQFQSEKEWRKQQKRLEKERRERWRAYQKNQRKWDRERREAAREYRRGF
jgi:hypothetical protein